MAASQTSGPTQCSTSPWPQTWASLPGLTASNTILDLPFRRLGCQNVEDHCRCVILIRLPAEPLHEVPERGGLHASDLFRGVRFFPIPVVVFLSAAHHQLRTPGEKLVLVRHSLRDQKVESGFSFVGVPDHSGGELGPLSGVLGNEAHYLLLTVVGYFSFVTRCSLGTPLESTHFLVENHTNSCFSGCEAGSSKISCSIPCSHGLTTCRVAVIRCSGLVTRPPQTCRGPCNSDP